MSKWAWGVISVPFLVDICLAAVEDGCDHPTVVQLSRLGGPQRNRGHMHRDLLRRLAPSPLVARLSSVPLWMKSAFNQVFQTTQQVLLPHALFAVLYSSFKEHFVSVLCGGSAGHLGEFWATQRQHPAFRHHPCRLRDLNKTMPISLHGDGVPVSGIGRAASQSVEAISWAPLLCSDATSVTNFLIAFVYKKMACTSPDRHTWRALWRTVAWSLQWLAQGLWPLTDVEGQPWPEGEDKERAGTPLADGLCAVVWVIRGDLEWMAAGLGLNRAQSNQPCVLCRADRSAAPFTDCRASAAWRSTVWESNPAWAAAHWRLPGLGVLMSIPDDLHTVPWH